MRILPTLLLLMLPAFADDSADTAVDRLARALAKEEALNPETKAALRAAIDSMRARRAQEDRALAAEIDDYLAATPPDAGEEPKRIWDRLDVYGDARLRYEFSEAATGGNDRHRARVRLRLGATLEIVDGLVFGARLITGNPNDPNSSHQTLGGVFNSFQVSLDRVFLKWTPSAAPGLFLLGGKFSNPIVRNPVYGELVWDADVNPEGVAAGYTIKDMGRLKKLSFVVGGFVVLEQGSANDAFMFIVQGAGVVSLAETLSGAFSVAYYGYDDMTPSGANTIVTGDNAGNAAIDLDADTIPDEFVSDFGIFDLVFALTFTGWDHPVTVSAEWIFNTEANIAGDTGWALGIAVGQTTEPGDWKFYYQFQIIEQDAVFSPFAQDDFLFQTNHRSHVVGAKVLVADKVRIHIWALVSELESGGGSSRWRFRIDVNIRF